MQYMQHSKEHMFTVYFRMETGICGGYWDSGEKQNKYTDVSLPAILLNTEKVTWLYSRAAYCSVFTISHIPLHD